MLEIRRGIEVTGIHTFSSTHQATSGGSSCTFFHFPPRATLLFQSFQAFNCFQNALFRVSRFSFSGRGTGARERIQRSILCHLLSSELHSSEFFFLHHAHELCIHIKINLPPTLPHPHHHVPQNSHHPTHGSNVSHTVQILPLVS